MVKTLSSEREIYKARVNDCEDKLEALEAEKTDLLSEKDEAIASANSLLDVAVAARVEVVKTIVKCQMEVPNFLPNLSKYQMEVPNFLPNLSKCQMEVPNFLPNSTNSSLLKPL
ncbi:hypothetical protein ACOSQ2_028395 [Xanthoceras sorbifolium]